MGNKYVLNGVVRDIAKRVGNTNGREWKITTFTLHHSKGKQVSYIKCKSFDSLNVNDGDVVELTNYYPKNESYTNQNGIKVYQTWIIVDEIENYTKQPQQPNAGYSGFEIPKEMVEETPPLTDQEIKETEQWLDFFSNDDELNKNKDINKERYEMLKREQERLNNQPPAPNWNDVQESVIEIEKLKDENNGW